MDAPAFVKQFQRKEEEHRASQPVELPDDIWKLIGYEPNEYQRYLHENERRFGVYVCHRRMGKSYSRAAKVIERAIEAPFQHAQFFYVAPTYQMVTNIAWKLLCQFAEQVPNHVIEKSSRTITVPARNGTPSTIKLFNAEDRTQSMRGLHCDGAVLDEFQKMPMSVWTEQVRPCLSDAQRRGKDRHGRDNQWCDIIGTPEGRNHFFDAYQNALDYYEGREVQREDINGITRSVTRDNWFACSLPASKTGIIDKDELNDALITQGRNKYLQEYECSFDAQLDSAIFGHEIAYLRESDKVGDYPLIPSLAVNTAWDLGISDLTVLYFFQIVSASEIRIIDYYADNNKSLPFYVDILAKKQEQLGLLWGTHLFPHDVEQRESIGGISRRDALRDMGVRVTVVPRVQYKEDAINTAQSWLPFTTWNKQAEKALDQLSLYRRRVDEKRGVNSSKPIHDLSSHYADAFETLAQGLRLIGHHKRNMTELEQFTECILH